MIVGFRAVFYEVLLPLLPVAVHVCGSVIFEFHTVHCLGPLAIEGFVERGFPLVRRCSAQLLSLASNAVSFIVTIECCAKVFHFHRSAFVDVSRELPFLRYLPLAQIMNFFDVFVFQGEDPFFELGVLLAKKTVFFSELIENFLFLVLHLLERFEFVLIFKVLLLTLFVKGRDHLLLFLDYGFQGLDLFQVVVLFVLCGLNSVIVIEIGVSGSIGRAVFFKRR